MLPHMLRSLHGQLYIFAEKWGIEYLKALVLKKVHKILSSFSVRSSGVSEIVKLLRQIYSDDVTTDGDVFREYLVQYIAYEIEIFTESSEHMDFLEEGIRFVRDIWNMVSERLL